MPQKQFTVNVLSLVFFLVACFHGSMVYAAPPLPPGSVLPEFKLKGPDSPQTKAYLGINDEKLFTLSQVKTKFVLIEFMDAF